MHRPTYEYLYIVKSIMFDIVRSYIIIHNRNFFPENFEMSSISYFKIIMVNKMLIVIENK